MRRRQWTHWQSLQRKEGRTTVLIHSSCTNSVAADVIQLDVNDEPGCGATDYVTVTNVPQGAETASYQSKGVGDPSRMSPICLTRQL